MSGPLGQPVIVDNRPGGPISAEALSRAPADGYTLLGGGGITWIVQLLQKAPYDAVRDFAPLSLISREVFVVAVHPSLPVKSVKELIALAKARPGELNYGSGLVAGAPWLAAELFKSMAGVNIVAVPYKGPSLAVTALISGEVQMTIIDAGLVAPHVKSGRLRALAVSSATPSTLAPGLPTVSASDVPDYEAIGMTGIWTRVKTPAAIIARLNQEIVRVIRQPEVKERLFNAGAETVGSSPEEFAAIIKSDIAIKSKLLSGCRYQGPFTELAGGRFIKGTLS